MGINTLQDSRTVKHLRYFIATVQGHLWRERLREALEEVQRLEQEVKRLRRHDFRSE